MVLRQMFIDQMVSYISLQTYRLDDCRIQMFLRWLKSHSSAVRNAESNFVRAELSSQASIHDGLKDALQTWFESLSFSGLIWEYELILTEIRWWRGLDERSLASILSEDYED